MEAELKSSTVGEPQNPPKTPPKPPTPPRDPLRTPPGTPPWIWGGVSALSPPPIPGLVTLNDMKAKQEALVRERERQLAKREQSRQLQL